LAKSVSLHQLFFIYLYIYNALALSFSNHLPSVSSFPATSPGSGQRPVSALENTRRPSTTASKLPLESGINRALKVNAPRSSSASPAALNS